MAIVNRTPDSFYDHGATWDPGVAREAVRSAAEQGADVIDIGGVPASPGPEVSEDEELRRVLPTVRWAHENYPQLVISVDTWRAGVARRVCEQGADLINDNWAAAEPEILEVAAEFGAGYICAHTDGLAPRTDPVRPSYRDAIASVVSQTTELARRAAAAGVPEAGIMLDPALDFNKNTWHSLQILRNTDTLVATGWSVLMALSNKGVVGETLDVPLSERVVGTLAATAHAEMAGAAMFRVHQVRETRETLEMLAGIRGERLPARPERYLT